MKTRKFFGPFIFVLLLAAIDQISKYMASVNLMFREDIVVIKGLLSLTYHENAGAAFGMFQGGRWFFLVFAVIIAVVIGYYYKNLPDGKVYTFIRFFLILILAGALGNSVDRLVNGYVVDFLQFDFIRFPIFNVADIFVVCGTFLMAITVLFFVKDEEL